MPSKTSGTPVGQRFLPGLKVGEGLTRHPFDEEYGVRTSGLVAGRHLKSGHPHDRHATAYYGVAPSVFRALMRRWKRSRPDWAIKDVSFVDIGGGMGRACLLAAQMPFRQVVGVELNPTLARIARKNMTAWRASRRALAPMKMICGDAVEFRLPPGPCLVFMFNPFGAPVMRRLLKAWSQDRNGRAGQLDLIYVNNEQEHALESERSGQPGFARVFLGKVPRSRADAIADHKILANQPEGEYASANYEDCSIWRWGKAGNGE
jgi:SAM-dependent methyltransferase